MTVGVWGTGAAARLDLSRLEARALELLQEDDLADLVPHLDDLLERDLRGRPRVRLLVALALAQQAGNDPRVDQLARAAWRSFQRARDREGLALTAYVQGRIADARGDLEAAAEWWARSRAVSGGVAAPVREEGLVDVGLRAWERSDLLTARRLGEESIQLSRARDNTDEATRAVALLAMLAAHEGDFGRAEQLVDAELAAVDENRVTTVGLLYCVRAVIAGHRGRHGDAEVAFEQALDAVERNSDAAMKGVVLAQRSELLTDRPSADRLREAWAASALLAGAAQYWSRMAVRAVAVAAADDGDREASDQAIESLLADDIDGMERGRALFVKANNNVRFGGETPVELFEESFSCLQRANANVWAVRVALAAAACDTENAERWRDRAASLSNGDEAFVRLLRTGRELQLDHEGRGQVVIDREPVQFLTRHAELTVYLLALAGKEGIDTGDLANRLWPDAPPRRHRPRLRTCLWQIRKAVGEEHWRLRRDRSRVYFDVDPHEFDRDGLEALVARFAL
ncbi:MAG: hypothetical protein HYX32_10400 [Actinobacteria bacterium]|nr:hypothetical protein [Actinomycetota bacterium]